MNFTFDPIGFFHGRSVYPQEAPRQGVFDAASGGVVELEAGRNFETALADLAGFGRIWLLYVFHRHDGWKPKVRPPDAPRRIGVLATRAPYRPNPIGLSAVRLLDVKGRCLYVAETDLLDGTPILDVKPYIPAADAFPLAAAGWRDELADPETVLEWSSAAAGSAARIHELGGPDLRLAAQAQLAARRPDEKRQRLTFSGDGRSGVLAFRTWRIAFERDEAAKRVTVTGIASGYTASELLVGAPDPYGDKEIHRRFLADVNPV